ncbi:MAG: GNAT family N-acetyltransferase [Bacteroidota bacterium]
MPENNMLNSFVIREATPIDIPKLASLHVITWADTYPEVKKPPTFEIREWQWKEQFNKNDNNWFCFVIENEKTDLIGFSKGIKEKNGGDLNKIYLLKKYHGQGLGKLLMQQTVRRFLSMGVKIMWVVAEPNNPTCAFYENMGGVRKQGTDPGVAVYVWRDLAAFKI